MNIINVVIIDEETNLLEYTFTPDNNVFITLSGSLNIDETNGECYISFNYDIISVLIDGTKTLVDDLTNDQLVLYKSISSKFGELLCSSMIAQLTALTRT